MSKSRRMSLVPIPSPVCLPSLHFSYALEKDEEMQGKWGRRVHWESRFAETGITKWSVLSEPDCNSLSFPLSLKVPGVCSFPCASDSAPSTTRARSDYKVSVLCNQMTVAQSKRDTMLCVHITVCLHISSVGCLFFLMCILSCSALLLRWHMLWSFWKILVHYVWLLWHSSLLLTLKDLFPVIAGGGTREELHRQNDFWS